MCQETYNLHIISSNASRFLDKWPVTQSRDAHLSITDELRLYWWIEIWLAPDFSAVQLWAPQYENWSAREYRKSSIQLSTVLLPTSLEHRGSVLTWRKRAFRLENFVEQNLHSCTMSSAVTSLECILDVARKWFSCCAHELTCTLTPMIISPSVRRIRRIFRMKMLIDFSSKSLRCLVPVN